MKITYVDKEKVKDSGYPDKNTGRAVDFNEIKNVVNDTEERVTVLENSIPLLKQKTGSTIVFTEYSEYNAITPVSSGDITIDPTNAVSGAYACFYFNGGTEPNIIGADIELSSGEFLKDNLNIYHFYWNTNGKIVLNIQNSSIQIEKLTTPVMNSIAGDSLVNLIFSLIDANAISNVLEKSTDGINYSVVGGYDGVSLSYQDTGLTNNTTYYYRFKSVASGFEDSNYSNTSARPVSVDYTILFQDTFDGTVIDTGKWVIPVIEPKSLWTQNNELINTTTASFSGIQEIKTDGLFNTDTTGKVTVFSFIGSASGNSDSYGHFRSAAKTVVVAINLNTSGNITIQSTGVNAFLEETSVPYNNTRVKAILDGNGAVSFKYWDGSAWVQLGNNASYGYEDDVDYFIRFALLSSALDSKTYDDVYVTDADYSTEIPV